MNTENSDWVSGEDMQGKKKMHLVCFLLHKTAVFTLNGKHLASFFWGYCINVSYSAMLDDKSFIDYI